MRALQLISQKHKVVNILGVVTMNKYFIVIAKTSKHQIQHKAQTQQDIEPIMQRMKRDIAGIKEFVVKTVYY